MKTLTIKKQTKRNIHSDKVMLCIWWDMKGVVCYDNIMILKPSETVTGKVYRRQLIRLKRVVQGNRPKWENRHNKLIL